MNARAAVFATFVLLAGCAPSTPSTSAPPTGKVGGADAQYDPARAGARHGNWIRAESVHKDLPIAWEFREDYVAAAGATPRLVIVSQAREIPYVGEGDATQRAEFAAREQRLLDALAGHAELVAVLDWRQQHDWYFYADASVTRESVAAALSHDAVGKDIRIDIETDGGEFYKTLKQRTGAASEKQP